MPYLQSEMIETASYDEEAHLLTIKFRTDGRVASYENVPQEIYDSLLFAASVAEFFETHIAGIYRVREESLGDKAAKWPSSLAASLSRSRATVNNRSR